MSDYQDLIKDFATDDELRDLTKHFAEECEAKHFDGLMAVIAPQSEHAWVGARSVSPLSTAFLFSSLAETVFEHCGAKPTTVLAEMLWYATSIESGYCDSVEKIIYKSREKDAIKLARHCLQKAITESRKEGRFPTIDAQLRKI